MSASMNNETKLGMSRAKLILTSFTIYQAGTLIFTFFYAIIIVGFKSKVEADIHQRQLRLASPLVGFDCVPMRHVALA